jgi:hypothetical protein
MIKLKGGKRSIEKLLHPTLFFDYMVAKSNFRGQTTCYHFEKKSQNESYLFYQEQLSPEINL